MNRTLRFQPPLSLGILRLRQKRFAEAKELLQTAIKGDEKDYLAHCYYARALSEEEAYGESIKSFKRAVELKSDIAVIHDDLAYAYLSAGQDTEAIEAFQQAIRLDPLNPYFYRSRSYVYLQLGRGKLAAVDALTYLRRQGWRDDHSPFMALAAYFGYMQIKNDVDAGKVLSEMTAKGDTGLWPYPVIQYLQQAVTEEELLAKATDNDKLTEAHTYIGLKLSLSGKGEEALTHLHWVKENGNKNFVEYPLVVAEISRIERGPK